MDFTRIPRVRLPPKGGEDQVSVVRGVENQPHHLLLPKTRDRLPHRPRRVLKKFNSLRERFACPQPKTVGHEARPAGHSGFSVPLFARAWWVATRKVATAPDRLTASS